LLGLIYEVVVIPELMYVTNKINEKHHNDLRWIECYGVLDVSGGASVLEPSLSSPSNAPAPYAIARTIPRTIINTTTAIINFIFVFFHQNFFLILDAVR